MLNQAMSALTPWGITQPYFGLDNRGMNHYCKWRHVFTLGSANGMVVFDKTYRLPPDANQSEKLTVR